MSADLEHARRVVALRLPWLAVDALRRRAPDLAGQPVATWQAVGNRRVLVCADAPPLRAGQSLADARAMLPDLVLRPADTAGEADLLRRLATCALRFTPAVALDAPDGLILDVTGATRLFGGETALLATLEEGFRRAGYRVRVAMAGNADAAAALVQAGYHGTVVAPGEDATALDPLPVAALRLPAGVAGGLARLGLRSVGAVLRQPRAPLARRFGRPLLDALDFATGARVRPLQPIQPPPDFSAARTFLEPIVTRPAIDRAVDTLLEELCGALTEAGRGARRLSLLTFRVDGDVQEVAVGVGQASRAPAHLRRLFVEPLGRLEPDLGFDRFVLRAMETNPLAGRQMATALGGAEANGDQETVLSELLDRLGQRVMLWRPSPTGSHWPERAVVPVDPFVPAMAAPEGWGERRRPVRLLDWPREVAVIAEAPNGPPARLRLDGRVHRVRHAAGPERLEPEWWGETHDRPRRDYFRVLTETGDRLWLCRLGVDGPTAPARWFLHGYLA
ncbi:MAG: DNA polymerase Y family protein [Roseomonas mucosa]|nr:DNA polymerase Y family protein [Roseomonas mucosa]